MSKVNYQTMSDRELKQYLLTHRDDKIAFETYMDRRHQKKTKYFSRSRRNRSFAFL